MKRATAITLAVMTAAGISAGVWWTMRPGIQEAANPPTAVRETTQPASNLSVTTEPVGSATSNSPAAAATPERQAELAALVTELDRLYATPAPRLTSEETSALTARRQEASRKLVDRVAALGAGGARAVAELYAQTAALRNRLLLLEGLGQMRDAEAATVLADMLSGSYSATEQQKIVTSLAHRPEETAIKALAGVATGQTEGGLRFAAVQGLSGRAADLPTLSTVIQTGDDRAVRLEAIHSVGLVKTDAAKGILIGLAQDGRLEPLVRQTAIQELRRTYGQGALGALQGLQTDANVEVGNSATKAVALLQGERRIPVK